ncbi:MAG: Sip1-related alpha-galactosidase, partial [Candidatus Brocadiaceae bacterium]
ALGDLNGHLAEVQAAAHAFRECERVPALLPGPDYPDSVAFYEAMIRGAGKAGFDFVKVDNQARNLKHYRGTAQPVRSAAHNSRALEAACGAWVDGLINCMAHNILCVFNTRTSAVSRCSEDYARGDAVRARRHLHNSYANMLWLGQTVWGDHDMFHSNDPAAGRMMALSKAMSGGPVYLSDAPGEFDAEAVRPLCLEDGELLRPLAPAAPLPDSIFLDPFEDGRPYRVVAPLPNRAAAVVAYNLSEPETPVEGRVGPEDYAHAGGMMQPRPERWELPEEGLLLYDWRRRTARPLDAPVEFRLAGFGDYFALLCPVRHGWAAVGRTDKYLSPAAVEVLYWTERELILRMVESGPLAIWRRQGAVHWSDGNLERAGDGLWVADLPVGERDMVFRCRYSRDRSDA